MGCCPSPLPALITPRSKCFAKMSMASAVSWRITTQLWSIAFSVSAVSFTLSPLSVLLPLPPTLMVSLPSILPATSKLARVRVEDS